MFVFLVHSSQVGVSVIHDLSDKRVRVCGAVSKKFGSKSVDDNWDGLNVQSVLKPPSRPVSFSNRHANLLNRDDLLTSLDTFKLLPPHFARFHQT